MRLNPSEKLEIIRLVEGAELGVNKTLLQLGINKSTFYNLSQIKQSLENNCCKGQIMLFHNKGFD